MKKKEDEELDLVEINPENCVSEGRSGDPKISLNSKSGVLSLNKTLLELVGITDQPDPKVLFHQGKLDPKTWYLEVGAEKGWELRTSSNGKNKSFNNVKLVRQIFDSVEFEGQYGSILISKKKKVHGEKSLWLLVTLSLHEIKTKKK